MPTLDVEGARIGYTVHGSGEPLLLGHSLLCTQHMWDALLPELARSYRVICIDFRGHGTSRSLRAFTLDDLVGDCLAVLDAEAVPSAIVGGLSMGGMVGMRLALRAPDRVSRLLLINTSASAEDWFKRLKYELLLVVYRRLGFVNWLARAAAELMLGRSTRKGQPKVVEQFYSTLGRFEPAQLVLAIEAVARRRPVLGLERIGIPVLVVASDEDRATSPRCSNQIQSQIEHAQLYQLRGIGHLSALEAPAQLLELMQQFLVGSSGVPDGSVLHPRQAVAR